MYATEETIMKVPPGTSSFRNALRFALRAKAPARHIEPVERGVRRGIDARDDVEFERGRGIVDDEPPGLDAIAAGIERFAVD